MNEFDNLNQKSPQFKIDFGKSILVTLIISMNLLVMGVIINYPAQLWNYFYNISLPLSFLCGGILAIIVLLSFLRIKWIYILEHLKITPKIWIILLSIGLFLFSLPFAEFLMSIFPTSGNRFLEELYKSTIESFELMLNYKIAGFITVCILAPVFEEILFRGILFRGLLQTNMNPVFAIILSSILFGLAHMNPWQFLGAGILGAIFAFIYYRTRSLWICIFLHSLNNTISFVLMVKFQSMEENVTDPNDFTSIVICLVIALLLGFGIYKLTPNIKWN